MEDIFFNIMIYLLYTGAMSVETMFGGITAFKISTLIYLKLQFAGRFWLKIWKLQEFLNIFVSSAIKAVDLAPYVLSFTNIGN